MNLAYSLKLYFVTLAAFFLIDMLWLGLVARGFYRQHLGHLLAPSTNWIAALIFYLLFVGGLLFFAVLPGLRADSMRAALLYGAPFGLLTYATYDLTNLATMKGWPLLVTVVDMMWGVALATSVSFLSFLAGKWLA